MLRIIKNFDPSQHGRWQGAGMYWDKQTGEAINIDENAITGRFVVPGVGDGDGNVFGKDDPNEPDSTTMYIGTDYFFELGVTVNLPDSVNLDASSSPVAVEPFGFATAKTADKVKDLIEPYVRAAGGVITGLGWGGQNNRFKYSQLQRTIICKFDGQTAEIPCGLVAQTLAGHVQWDHTKQAIVENRHLQLRTIVQERVANLQSE